MADQLHQIDQSYDRQIGLLKRNVTLMLEERAAGSGKSDNAQPAPIWLETLSVFNYMINLSADDFRQIRYHTSLITGESILTYWHQYPPFEPELFARNIGYEFYTRDVPKKYQLGEPAAEALPRPLGVEYQGRVLNGNISRYQSCVSNLYSMGILDSLSEKAGRCLALEIGGGYGGLAHGLGNILAGNTTYIILDLPEMLLFSGGYLILNNPKKKIYIYEPATFTADFLKSGIYNYDYVLLPNFILGSLYQISHIDLMINMQSFQEMSKEQIAEYLDFGHARLTGYLYSDNIDKHPFNENLAPATVTSLLDSRFSLFPSPEFFDRHLSSSPWPYRQYVGVAKDREITFPKQGPLRIIDQSTRYRVFKENSSVRVETERDIMKCLMAYARKLIRR
jgi:hypothetical protein